MQINQPTSKEYTSNILETEGVSTYSVSGFRSLLSFNILIKPGLNVLVGPNGSGKTNFIEFLDFLDATIKLGASNAISSLGGLARVFSQEQLKKTTPSLLASVSGDIAISDIIRLYDNSGEDKRLDGRFKYEYKIELKFNRNSSIVYISKECLRINKIYDDRSFYMALMPVGCISVLRRYFGGEINSKWHISRRLYTKHRRNPLNLFPQQYLPDRSKEPTISRIKDYNFASDESFLLFRRNSPPIEAVCDAIIRGRSFNIIPDEARTPDDMTTRPGIRRDGAGLSTTLYHLQLLRKPKSSRRPRPLMGRATRETMDMVLEWAKLVFPALTDISVTPDPHSGKYLAHLILEEDNAVKISLQSASDGTIKWLSLVCLILTSGGVFSLEEPENFLHPKVQHFLVSLIRDSINDEARGSFLFSTHSETIINQCAPEELIIFDYKGGYTSCRRISNPKTIENEINKTGFGLGYYYASNALP